MSLTPRKANRGHWVRPSLIAFLLLISISLVTDASDRPPNIIFVLADDLGWAELGCYGNRFNETPNLDRIASEGIRFTDAYASAPVCSPYRASFLTGQHPVKTGIIDYLRPNSANALSKHHITLPKILSRSGYATGMIGKWHLTGYQHHGAEFEIKPRDHGFQWDFGREVKSVGNGANFWPYVFRNQKIRWIDIPENRLGKDEYLTNRLNHEAVRFIERNREKPFFLYLSHYAPHTILNGSPELVEKYKNKHVPGRSSRRDCYLCEDAGLGKGDPGHHWATDHNPHLAAMLESIDQGIGMISRKLDQLGLTENTILVFTSDNGGELNVTSNAPLRGGKSTLYEGGIRVPLIVRWPKALSQAGICRQPTQNIDFYPTFLEAAGIAANRDQELDGESILPFLRNPDRPIERRVLTWHYPLDRPHFLGGVSAGAIRDGHWKLIEHFDSGKLQLFSLAQDPGEKKDLAATHSADVKRLLSQLKKWRQIAGARHPSPPLITEKRQLYFAEHFNPSQLSKRLWYSADWKAEDGVLKRLETGTRNARIFLRDAKFNDSVIRFDFRMGSVRDIRMLTGSNGPYNTVLHIRPDHFFLQTAKDESIPCFSYRHGECAFQFQPGKWYTMTVEFLGDEAVAHIDSDHVVHARHPIINRQRTYFALQVDQHAAEFDNVQIFNAVRSQDKDGRAKVDSSAGKHPVQRSILEDFEIKMSNAHEWNYQRDKGYRNLVIQVDNLDDRLKQQFPDAFRSHKEIRKAINEEKKRLLKTDSKYKETLYATYKANNAIDQWIVSRQPDLKTLEQNRKKAAIDQLASKYSAHPEMVELVEKAKRAQSTLEANYPKLFLSDEQITRRKKTAYESLRDDPMFKKMTRQRAEAYYASREYLLKNDPELKRLAEQIKNRKRDE